MKKYDQEVINLLSKITDTDEMAAVLTNMLTPQEREELALRLQIFKGLISGESQRELAKRLNVSLATVSRGSRELKYGPKGLKRALGND